MESCIKIVHDTENNEYVVEAYGAESQHLGSRSFKEWIDVCIFLSCDAEIDTWLKQIASGEITNAEALQEVREWPA